MRPSESDTDQSPHVATQQSRIVNKLSSSIPSSTTNSSSPTKNTGPLSDLGLTHLRAEIKNTMLPLLIRVFEMKQAISAANMPPSRLQKQSSEPPEKIGEQLSRLTEDLRQLILWCQSCQNQINKAIQEIEKGPNASIQRNTYSEMGQHAAIEKSFSEAVARNNAVSEPAPLTSQQNSESSQDEPILKKDSWKEKLKSLFSLASSKPHKE